ncbi:oligosaccharide flippase family protein [Clostridium perfringens]|uniref:lipopolysaccharide biosynthesis protein n=1 Tax=Clostridium perfringens TaxID=1502 RepID=UPI002904B732|nr:oligosaccharide flippase family protein [Clostridium perfringens]EHA1184359.1 oligosaccharide flippase family protein [Clostridium perfringens]EHK2367093.1 oligosaccharide flippase family protein [Clostridium perfringens]MDU2325159.1 oligosaccharide flippase family protein [Clostridium perfringens]
MSEGRTNKSLKNIFTGLIYKFIGIFCPFIIRTIMIKELGADYIGLNQLFTSILQVLSLTELGIGNAMVYSMYKPMAEGDTDKICALLSLCKKLYRIIGIIVLVIGIVILPFLGKLIKGGYPSDINIYILYLIYLFNTVISYFLFAYKKSILDAKQEVSIENTIYTVISLGMYLCQVFALLYTKNYYIYLIFLPISTMLLNLIRNYIINRKYPVYACRGNIDNESLKEFYEKIKALIGDKIGGIVLWFADSIVISAFLGLQTLAIYSNYYYIMNAIVGIMAIIYNSVLASVGNSLVTETKEKNHIDFMVLNFMNLWIVSWCAICLLCLYQPFMQVWMGAKLMLPFSSVILFCLYFYGWLFNKIGNTYINAAGLWNKEFWRPYVSSGINLIFNIFLVKRIGLPGVLLSTIISSVIIDTTWETYVLYKYLFRISCRKYIIKLIYHAIITILCAIVTYYICNIIAINNNISIIFYRLAICIVVPNFLLWIIYKNNIEYKTIKVKYKEILKRN